jgi:putative endonuclease
LKRGVAYYVYMLASGRNGTLYVGVTNDLVRRVYEHRCGAVPGFTRRYDVQRWCGSRRMERLRRPFDGEKSLKRWLRAWKIALIERTNPAWRDLYDEVAG